jgi:glycerophosphoryl diester phosphodiesterase
MGKGNKYIRIVFHQGVSEEIELIQGLNYSMNKSVGIYPEIKSPEFHLAEGKDLSAAVLKVMKEYGYNNKRDKVFLQTFSWSEIKRLREILMPEAEMDLNLVMLAGTEEEYQWMFNREGMREVGRYADGFGPTKSLIIDTSLDKERVIISDLVKLAHDNGMQVHPYTFRSDTRGIPDYAESFDDLLRYFYFEAGVDGIFTDFPDQAVKFLSNQ